MTRRMLRAVADPHTNVLGHCTGRLVQGSRGTRPQSTFDAKAVFTACAEHGVAVEINSRPERQDPPDELIALALELGCLFSIDSDAHAPGHSASSTWAPRAPRRRASRPTGSSRRGRSSACSSGRGAHADAGSARARRIGAAG